MDTIKSRIRASCATCGTYTDLWCWDKREKNPECLPCIEKREARDLLHDEIGAAMRVAQHAATYALETGDCVFCTPDNAEEDQALGHEVWCPVPAYLRATGRGSRVYVHEHDAAMRCELVGRVER